MEYLIKEMGKSLVEYAENTAEYSAQRGLSLTEELFPFIYQASRRLSARAISRFLLEEHKVKLSSVTISKALREADKYWLRLHEAVEPAARIFGEAHKFSTEGVLELEDDSFEALSHEKPFLPVRSSEEAGMKMDELEGATSTLRDRWFALDADTRRTCLGSIPDEQDEDNEAEVDNGETTTNAPVTDK